LNSALLLPFIIPSIHWNKKFILRAALFFGVGFIVGLLPFYFNFLYYKAHPELLIHVAPSVKLSWASFLETLYRFNNYFDQVSPLFWRFGFISVLILPAAIILLWKKNKRLEAWTIVFVLLAILGSFFLEKTKESSYSLFFSGGRFFLALPFVFIFLSLYFYSFLSSENKLNFNRIGLALAVVSFGIKTFFFSSLLTSAMDESKSWCVHVVRISDLKKQCAELVEFGDHPSLLIAITGDTPGQPVTYGCQCLQAEFPSTYIPHYERRRWLISEYNKTVFPTILLHGKDTARWDRSKFGHLNIVKHDKEKGWMLVRNSESTDVFLFESGILTPNK
jgi:drug/metabolite transporter superfamily protein YnfA